MPLSLAPQTAPPVALPTDEDLKEHNEFFKFTDCKPFLTELRDSFKVQITAAKANRERRKINVDLEAERAAGRIKQSDTLVPMRVIDEAIAREKPGLIAYLQQSRRLAIFVDKLEPDKKHDALEAAFTRGMTYQDWISAHYKVIDGGQLHGWDWYEVLYDETKPLHVGIEAVGNDKLYFPLDTEDIQNCSRIMREFNWTKTQLTGNVKKFGFVKDQVDKVLKSSGQHSTSEGTTKDKTFKIFKVYFKFDGIVYVGWMSFDGCDDWLKSPVQFYNGIDEEVTVMVEQPPMLGFAQLTSSTGQPVPIPQPPIPTQQWQPKSETLYPTIPFFYEDTEQKEVSEKKGRAFKDKFKQEVMTVGWTSYLNGHNRATWIIPFKDEMDGKPISQFESITIADGKPIPFKVGFLKMPYPDPAMLQGLQAFDSKIATSSGQMTYAVQSKTSGARTTATEVQSAEKDTNLLSSVNITLFAGTARKVYSNSWLIAQSQALQGKIDLYGQMVEVPSPSPEFESEWMFQNDNETISREFDIRPAGDVDVIQRQELIQKMMQYWAIVANTPIAMPFLAHLLKIEFAEQGEIWAQQLMAGDPIILLQQMYDVVKGIMEDPSSLQTLDPISKQNLMMLMQATQAMISQRQQQQPTNGQSKSNGESSTSSTGVRGQGIGGTNSSPSSMVEPPGDKTNLQQPAKVA